MGAVSKQCVEHEPFKLLEQLKQYQKGQKHSNNILMTYSDLDKKTNGNNASKHKQPRTTQNNLHNLQQRAQPEQPEQPKQPERFNTTSNN